MAIFTHTIFSPVGKLWLGDYQGKLCFVQFTSQEKISLKIAQLVKDLNANLIEKETSLLIEAQKQLKAYFRKERFAFSLPFLLIGTNFQKSVWQILMTIPYGETCSYQDVAKQLGNINAVRAVGTANNANLLPIIIPCHRVIQKNGKLGGYDGGIEVKQFLLTLESKS